MNGSSFARFCVHNNWFDCPICSIHHAFLQRLLINSSLKSNQSVQIEKKLDKIIELLEKEKNA